MDIPRRPRKPGRRPAEKTIVVTAQELQEMSVSDLIEMRTEGKLKNLPFKDFQAIFAQHPTIQNLPYDKPEELAKTLTNYHLEEEAKISAPIEQKVTYYLKHHLDHFDELPPATQELVDDVYKKQRSNRDLNRTRIRRQNLSQEQRLAYRARENIARRNRRCDNRAKSKGFASKFEYLLHKLALPHRMTASDLEELTRHFREYYKTYKSGEEDYINEMLQYLTKHGYHAVEVEAAKEAREAYLTELKSGAIHENPFSADEEDFESDLQGDPTDDHIRGHNTSHSGSQSMRDTSSYLFAPSNETMSSHQHFQPSYYTGQSQSQSHGVLQSSDLYGDAFYDGGNAYLYHNTVPFGSEMSIIHSRDGSIHDQYQGEHSYKTATSPEGHSSGSGYAYADVQPNNLAHRPQDIIAPITGFNQWEQTFGGIHEAALSSPFHDVQVPEDLGISLADLPDLPFDPHEMDYSFNSWSAHLGQSHQPSHHPHAPGQR